MKKSDHPLGVSSSSWSTDLTMTQIQQNLSGWDARHPRQWGHPSKPVATWSNPSAPIPHCASNKQLMLDPEQNPAQEFENWNLRSTMSFKTPRKLRQKRGSGQIFEESAHKIDENLWPSLQLMVFPSKTNKIWGKELQLLVGKGDISLHRLNQHFINVHWMVHGVLHFPLTTHHTTTSTNRPPVLVRLRITSLHLVQSIFSATCPHNLIHCQSLAETKTQERHV